MVNAVGDVTFVASAVVVHWAHLVGPGDSPQRRGLNRYFAPLPLLIMMARRSVQAKRPHFFDVDTEINYG